jgi:hypothetical protein
VKAWSFSFGLMSEVAVKTVNFHRIFTFSPNTMGATSGVFSSNPPRASRK